MQTRSTYLFKGTAIKPDKTRGISVGDEDYHCMIAWSEEDATERCPLDSKVLLVTTKCGDAWQTLRDT